MGAVSFQDFCNTFFLAKVLFREILDTQVILAGDLFGVRNQFVPQALSKLRVVKDTDFFPHTEMMSYPLHDKKGARCLE